MDFANGAKLLAAFPMRAAATGATVTGWYVAFERGPDDTVSGSDFHRWGSAWIRTLDAPSWSHGHYHSTDYGAMASAMDRAGWAHVVRDGLLNR